MKPCNQLLQFMLEGPQSCGGIVCFTFIHRSFEYPKLDVSIDKLL